jgi:hypothetical protein
MTTLQKKSHADSVRQRRSSQPRSKPDSKKTRQTTRQAYRTGTVFLPVEPHPAARRTPRQAQGSTLQFHSGGKHSKGRTSSRLANTRPTKYGGKQTGTRNPRQNGYDFAFSLGRTAIHAPALNLPQLGPRWVSAGLTLLLGILLYTMWTANTFIIPGAEVSGNQRLDTAEVSAMLGMVGQPIFKAIPSQIENNLRTAFPDLAGVSVQVGFPNHIRVVVVERTPILAWSQDGNITWIDSNGVAFMPRGNVPGLIPIVSNGDPPKVPGDPTKSIYPNNGYMYDQPLISPAMVQAIVTLSPQVPVGAPMIYDPKYGMGWQDPRGWSVYFGQNTQDIPMKQKVYQAILDTITRQGIQPTLISVEYLGAPFYK